LHPDFPAWRPSQPNPVPDVEHGTTANQDPPVRSFSLARKPQIPHTTSQPAKNARLLNESITHLMFRTLVTSGDGQYLNGGGNVVGRGRRLAGGANSAGDFNEHASRLATGHRLTKK